MVELSHASLDAVFHALSDPTRRTMVGRLAQGAHTVSELAEPFQISLAAASKHIKVLEHAGLLKRDVQGRVHWCSLDPAPLRGVQDWLRFYDQFWTGRLDTLDDVIKNLGGKNNG